MPKFDFCDRMADVRYWPKADISLCTATYPLSGVKRTCRFALRVSAFDPKRTLKKIRITDGFSVG